MKKACRDCSKLSSYSAKIVSCKGYPDQYVEDYTTHLDTFICENFEPNFFSSWGPDVQILQPLFDQLANSELSGISEATLRWLSGPPNDVNVQTSRGMAMLSVSEDDLESFEHEKEFKSYEGSNHMFADLLVPVSKDIKIPIIFFLSRNNSPGTNIIELMNPTCIVISLGLPYSFSEVSAAISFALGKQDVKVIGNWFRTILENQDLDPEDPAFENIVGIKEEDD